MQDDTDINHPRRRVILRRARQGGGFSAGASTRSESLRAPREDEIEADEVDELVDPDQMNREVRALPPPPSLARGVPSSADGEDERDNPRQRLNQVAMAGSSAYAKEYRLQLLHRLLMRNIPLDQIAQQLQVSISTIEKDRAELKRRFREAAKELTIEEIIGNEAGIYDEVTGMSLRLASHGDTPTAMKLASMRTALAARADKTRFLNTAGVFDVLRFKQAEDGTNLSDVQRLMQNTADLLASLNEEDDEPTGEPPPPRAKRIARTPRKAGSFKAMTFDDAEASTSATETQEL